MQHYTINLRNCPKVRYNLQLHVIRGDYNIIDKQIHISIHMHQSIPPAPSPQPPTPLQLTPGHWHFWMANSCGWVPLSSQIPPGGDEKRGQIPCPPSTLQHFSLIAQSNSTMLSILMCDFLFQVTSSFVIALGF